MTLKQAVEAATKSKRRPMTVNEIAEAALPLATSVKGKTPNQQVYSILYTEATRQDGVVERVGKGLVQAQPEAPEGGVTVFVVCLVVRDRSGASIGSTKDIVEATDADEAERIAIERWRALRPTCRFGRW